MSKEKDLYQQLLDEGYAKRDIHNVLHVLMMEIIKNKKAALQQTISKPQKEASVVESFKYMIVEKLFALIP